MTRLDIEACYRERDVADSATANPNDARAAARERLRRMRARRYLAGLTARGEAPLRPDWSKAEIYWDRKC